MSAAANMRVRRRPMSNTTSRAFNNYATDAAHMPRVARTLRDFGPMRTIIITTTTLAALVLAIACGPSGTQTGASGSPAAVGTSSASPSSRASASASPSSSALASPSSSASASASAGAVASPSASASGAAASPSSATATSSPAASASGAAAASNNTCSSGAAAVGISSVSTAIASLVTTSDVQALIGTTTNPPSEVELPMTGFTVSACIWTSANGTLTVALGPKNLTKDSFDTAMKSATMLTPLSGVGDSAFSIKLDVPQGMAGSAGIVVLKNGTYFSIQSAHKTKTSDELLKSITDLAKSAS